MILVCRVPCDGLIIEKACTLSLFRRPRSSSWWARCYVEGEKGKDWRWSTHIGTSEPDSETRALASARDRLITPLGQRPPRRRRMRGANMTIYFVRAGDRIKIGITGEIKGRLAKMKSDSSVPLELLGSRVGGLGAERALHVKFAAHKVHGEWFQATAEIVAEASLRP